MEIADGSPLYQGAGCNLSNPKYGYDFVISTTQASINSDLCMYLHNNILPCNYFCFLSVCRLMSQSDNLKGMIPLPPVKPANQVQTPSNANAVVPVTLEDLVAKTGGVDPFKIPRDTPHTDPRVQALTKVGFAVGVKIRMGLPPGVEPKDLSPILELGDVANFATFNILCSDFHIVENELGTSASPDGKWNVWRQPSGRPWTLKTWHVLQSAQLLLDMDNATVQNVPVIEGMRHGSRAHLVVSGQLGNIWTAFTKQCHCPPISVVAVPQTSSDPSKLHLKSFDLQVNRVKDSNGDTVKNPTKEQLAATTLDYRCTTSGTQLPPAKHFSWNWVEPTSVNSESGVVAIKREVFGQYLLDAIIPKIKKYCITTDPVVGHRNKLGRGKLWADWSLPTINDQTPKSLIRRGSTNILVINYFAIDDPDTSSTRGSIYGSEYCRLDVVPGYECNVGLTGNSLKIFQRVAVNVRFKCDVDAVLSNQVSNFDEQCMVYNEVAIDDYELSVGQTGCLQITHTKSSPESYPNKFENISDLFQTDDLLEKIRSCFTAPAPIDFTSVNAAALQNFVFPGGKVFTYKNVRAAPSGDLLCSLTYVDPDEAITSPAMLKIPAAKAEDDSKSAPVAVPAPVPATPASLTFTTEMMQNYVPGEIVNPTGKFEALQTQDGHSILFNLSSANVFQAIVEHSGASSTGWRIVDLSSSTLSSAFASDKSAVVKTFDANQSAVDGTISLAMVVTSGGTDHLLLSLYNHNSTAAWTPAPTLSWKTIPFDASSTSSTAIGIAGVMFAESDATHKQHIIVDIDRSTSDKIKQISRFYVNPLATDKHWTPHDVPVDIQDGNYQSCVGRFQNELVDGVFTCGVSGTSGQLVYVPISNAFGSGPPASRTLSLPGNVTASAIATARAYNNSTDLYAIGGQTLFWFPANSQAGQSVATTIFSNSIFQGTTELSAMTHGGVTTIWGKNGSDQIYYSSCPNTQLGTAASWSTPLPLMNGIENMSAFVNRTGYSNTIFASGGTSLWRLVQATETTAKLWRQESLVIEGPPKTKAIAFNSYTTTIQLADDKKMPAGDVSVSVTAPSRTPVYINGLYYVLSSTPITVSSDKTGTLTVVENTHNTLNGTSITVTCGGHSTVIDPSHKHFQKITSLDTPTALGAATIPKNVVAGGTSGTPATAPLIDSSTSSNDKQTAAATLGNLNTVYGAIKNPNAPLKVAPKPVPPKPIPEHHPSSGLFGSICDTFEDIGHAIEADVGDIFHALKSVGEAIVHIVKEAASDVWHFVTTIAGKVYHAVLSTVDAVVGAVEWVFSAIKTVIQDVIRFLEFLLDWEDITRTKEVISNIAKRFMQGQIDLIATAKPFFDQEMNSLVSMINKWAGDTSWTDTIGQATTQPLSANCRNPSAGQTSGSQMLSNHYKNNASSLTLAETDTADSGVEELVSNLMTALENEGKTLTAAYNNLKALAHKVSSQPLQDSLKQLLAIIADVFTSTVGNLGDAILDLLTSVASSAMHLLDTKFHIPIISDLLSDLGISEPSLLDLFCWIAAVAYTVVYKIEHDSAPFHDNDDVTALINADSWHTLQTILGQPPAQEELSYYSRAASYLWSAPKELSDSTKKTIYLCMHSIGGTVDLLNIFVIPLEADGSSDSKVNRFSSPMSILNYLHIACSVVAGYAVSQDPISNDVLKAMHYRNIAVSVVAGPVLKKFLKADGTNRGFPALDQRGMRALVKVVVGYWGLFVTAGHLYELSHEAASSSRTAAIMMEVGNILGEVRNVAYCEAVNDPDRTTREIPLLVVAGVGLIETGLELSLLATVD
ncbi:hypothetical protein FVEG_11781 [Fusarium verticillioides 7600]|uniref:Uncharacterized protein n=1 Tax=Gibberella moniliformis (strain M3125 / FGSC 7600) TaxID=334819 RepID=W7MPD0_GIBM7|nr:hypothetical protein FVEG_11781 [Fusarium verticillioides 7600]EWG53323.1 hypothetical protein FVEG_11781 [Fusarium verticillioides 7600]